MSLDGKVLKRAKDKLDERRLLGEAETKRRLLTVYRDNPRVKELDEEIRLTVINAVGHALSNGIDPELAIDEISADNLELQKERAHELMGMGLPEDYTDEKFFCPKCRDTGYDGTKLCSCLMELYAEEQRAELSAMLDMGGETFDTFELDYYDDTPDESTGISPRANMEIIYDYCVHYAEKFGRRSGNLLFTGDTGLGKTFLSSCIAKVVSEKGFSVVYDTAPAIFARFEDEKFAKDDMDAVRADVNKYLACDLLIIDDLGTELATAFVTSALYNLINTRLMTGKKTVISTNCPVAELAARYSAQIASRLTGEYEILRFFGSDIRLIKKQQR